jgi:hypothetical protein
MIIIINKYGFFSNFLKVLHWNIYSKKTKDIIIVYFSDYINSKTENIWDKMFLYNFEYKLNDINNSKKYFNYPHQLGYKCDNILDKEEIYGSVKIYYNSIFNDLRILFNNSYKDLKWTKFLENYVSERNIIKTDKKTIAVAIRTYRHYRDTDSSFIYKIMEELSIITKYYDEIFLLTNIKEYHNMIIEKFKNKVIFLEKKLLNEHTDWDDVHINLEKEYLDSFTDVYLASRCNFFIGGPSNMMLGTLFINPNLQFKIFDCLKNTNAH